MCDLSPLNVEAEPFHHISHPEFIEQTRYRELCQSFPTCPPRIGPTGFSLYWGDEGYQQLLAGQPAWQDLFNTFHSQMFIDWSCEQFAGIWEREGCKIDLSRARYVPYREDRIDKERAKLRKVEHAAEDLWVRMDIHQGRMGYDRPVHLDHARRLISMLIYMCDHTENAMRGGELILHRGKRQTSHSASAVAIAPRHNLMIAFPCTSHSYHSVSAITALQSPRNYIQVHISSSIDIWPRPAVPRWRRTLSSLKQQLKSVSDQSATRQAGKFSAR
ncbi:MAG: 2OG-Fe(II) oxygenase [bacterium]